MNRKLLREALVGQRPARAHARRRAGDDIDIRHGRTRTGGQRRAARHPRQPDGLTMSGGLFSIARSALLTHQTALQTISQNIANAETPGYSRQEAVLVANTPVRLPYGNVGTGVHVETIIRKRDILLDESYRDAVRSVRTGGHAPRPARPAGRRLRRADRCRHDQCPRPVLGRVERPRGLARQRRGAGRRPAARPPGGPAVQQLRHAAHAAAHVVDGPALEHARPDQCVREPGGGAQQPHPLLRVRRRQRQRPARSARRRARWPVEASPARG